MNTFYDWEKENNTASLQGALYPAYTSLAFLAPLRNALVGNMISFFFCSYLIYGAKLV
jgi:hypothetical protein